MNELGDPPDGDDGPEPNPAEADLVAYLDGELDPPAARRVEARLAADPALRARAAALKRSFDLLDFLPKPEPSPTFATRTMERVPTVQPAASASVPVVLASGTIPMRHRPSWVWAAGLLVAVGVALGGGYLVTAAARSHSPPPASKDSPADALPLADHRVIENLPLYAAADDLDFIARLADPDLFGDELVVPDGPAPPHPVEADKPTGPYFDQLQQAFRDLPPERQEKIRQLDRQLHEQDRPHRERTLRVLEVYAAWLQRSPEPDRRDVLAAPTPEKRLEAIREARNGQWVAALPVSQRQKLKGLPKDVRAGLIAQLRADDEVRSKAWQTARMHWETLRTGKPPWPFGDKRMQEEVAAFARAAYRPDDPNPKRPTRLSVGDRDRLREALEMAESGGQWMWLGKTVYDLSRNPRYEMLPEPAGEPLLTVEDLKEAGLRKVLAGPGGRKDVQGKAGRWPDFALAVWEHAREAKLSPAAAGKLGPSRPEEYREDVRQFLRDLSTKASPTEWAALKALETRWPEYPREMIRLAKAHDLSVPGAMPPGPPSLWEKTYNSPRPVPPRPGG